MSKMNNCTTRDLTTIGILYPGEMGSSLGKVLSENGYRVVTTVEERSSRTRRLCLETGLEILNSFREVVQAADIIISVVPPAAAVQVAEQYASFADLRSRTSLYIDANSISPETTKQIGDLLSQLPINFVDAAVHGLASRLRTQGTIYLSGPHASDVAELFGRSLRTRIIGETIGQASVFKMLLSGMSKGLVALFLEMSLLAREEHMLDSFLSECREYYPGIMTAIDRLLPTYPQHASRRADELRELETTMFSLSLEPGMVHGAQQLIAAVGQLSLAEQHSHNDSRDWTVCDVVEEVYGRNPLRLHQAPPQ
jgi:hypothetical protein